MVLGWRRAFCTSIREEKEQKLHRNTENSKFTPRIASKFGFLSNPSRPRFQSDWVSRSGLRCRTTAAATPTATLPSSPKLQCRTTSNATPSNTPRKHITPRLFSSFSNPSSPKSSSPSFPLLKNTLRSNKSGRCGICLQYVKKGQGTAIFSAECSHLFHFPCIASLASNSCPVCAATWREALLLPISLHNATPDQKRRPEPETNIQEGKIRSLRVYNDDEPLMTSPISMSQFNTILESDENDDVQEEDEFPSFSVNTTSMTSSSKVTDPITRNLEVRLQPEAAVVTAGRRFETYAVVMKVKAPPGTMDRGERRHPVDLVTVLDVSGGVKLQTVKQAMRLVISLLRERDRLSIIVFSSGSKRLLPLRRMTAEGRRLARRTVDALVCGASNFISVRDAVKKAVKVLEDRREKNPSASILVLSDGQDHPEAQKFQSNPTRLPFVVSSTRFSHLDIPVHSFWIGSAGALHHAPVRDAFTDRISGLLHLVLREVTLKLGLVSGSSQTEIASVYSLSCHPKSHGSGSVFLGDLFADEERDLLVEIKVPASSRVSHHVMSVQFVPMRPTSHNPRPTHAKERLLLVPRPQAVRSTSPAISRLRNLHVSTLAIAESRGFVERNDFAGAHHILSSARATLAQLGSDSADEFRLGVEEELAYLSRLRRRSCLGTTEEKTEQLTPTSAWKAAERLAKVAIMKKHMNRVSDLHGFENARF